ncbi:MAG: MFS transporter [Anaerolineae bacterium]|nr:MFS transporter [Anaerolineae bacterium]
MNTLNIPRRDAALVYLLISGSTALFTGMIFTVNMIYQVTTVGLDPLQLVLVGTTLEMTVFVFEVPTGIVADVYSRRLSIIIGMFVMGVGFMLEGLVPRFGAVLLSQVLWGFGYTFTSGATEAWISDEIGEQRAGRAFLRGSQVGMIGGLAAIPLAVALGTASIRLPIVTGGALFVALGVYLVLVMPEDGFQRVPAAERSTWDASLKIMRGTLRDGVQLIRARQIVLILVGVSALMGLYSEGVDRLWTKHMLDNFTLPASDRVEPVVWFGLISAISSLVSLAVTEIIRRRLDLSDQTAIARALFSLTALTALGILVFALAGAFGLALAALWLTQITRRVSDPVYSAWLNQHIDSKVRATVFSMTGQVNAIGQIAGGPVVGWIGTAVSVRAALTTSGAILAAALPFYARTARRED